MSFVAPANIPSFLYGTAWKEERTEALTRLALEAGFVGIDTANQRKHYYEEGVGRAVKAALAAGSVTRERLFLQTKFTFRAGQDRRLPYDPSAKLEVQVVQSCQSSLVHLGVETIDSYLLHGPSQRDGLGDADWQAWTAMEGLQRAGTVLRLGVSNVTLSQLQALCTRARVAPSFVQNRCYARTGWDRDVRRFCAARGIVYQGFSLLTANSREMQAPAIVELAAQRGCSPAEIVFGFALCVGMLPLTGTSSPEHMRLDLAAQRLALEPHEIEAIERVAG